MKEKLLMAVASLWPWVLLLWYWTASKSTGKFFCLGFSICLFYSIFVMYMWPDKRSGDKET
jgi:hypothetical protein